MISKSMKTYLARRNLTQGLVATQARSMGGGEKKPNMPASEMNFDVVFVGKYS
jgi:hypothetical protein